MFVYRQPRNAVEVDRLLHAAWTDPLAGYGWDGDRHWTTDPVRTWWRERARLRAWAIDLRAAWSGHPDAYRQEAATGLSELLTYLDGGLETDLRLYLFRLEERRSPNPSEPLPELDP
ncbi:hypothetical protein ACGFYY_08595 [Streptomyces sp. NPDC048331]|uniref:hypothetical protein n=1 Tax=Streptomyces sp. NPDC048331 TaxID=3365534 RepID=UPI0037191956